jgi:adenosylcobinamide-phosphate synthase
MGTIERRTYRDTRPAGLTYTGIGVATGWAAGHVIELLLERAFLLRQARSGLDHRQHASPGILVATAVAGTVAIAGRMLGETGERIAQSLPHASDGSLDIARELLPSLVGRDATSLDATGIARAVIESVAENTVDAVVAPALWGALFGASGVLAYRAINTMDAMVGHHSDRYERFGWASARLDDIANYLPARATALLVACVRPTKGATIIRIVKRDAPAHPSPNSGVAEAAFAAAINRRLGGVNRYGDRVENRGVLGDGEPADAEGVFAATRLLRDVTIALVWALTIVPLVANLRSLRSKAT